MNTADRVAFMLSIACMIFGTAALIGIYKSDQFAGIVFAAFLGN